MCDAIRDGQPIATDLAITSGSVTDESAPGIRRTLSIELFPTLGLYELLAPIGTELHVRSVIRYPSGATETVPLGVYDIDSESMSYGSGGSIRVSGSDKWGRIQRAQFLLPQASLPGMLVTDQIATLIRGALGSGENVTVTATSTATVGALVWEKERDTAILDLAKSIGARVSFDRTGVATIEDLPTIAAEAVWTVDASPTGVMLSGSRDRNRKRTYNMVVVVPEKADGQPPFAPQFVWDNDPNSPTYAGSGGIGGAGPTPPSPDAAGPFGHVPYYYVSPLLETADQAIEAGRTILARVTGMAAQLSLEFIRNHALDSLDAIDALLPAERFDQPQPLERHVIDRIVHPLVPSGSSTIDTRSTRTDEYT